MVDFAPTIAGVFAMLAILFASLSLMGSGSVSVSITCDKGQHQVRRNLSDGYELWCAKNRHRGRLEGRAR